jgi:hypothetical protein
MYFVVHVIKIKAHKGYNSKATLFVDPIILIYGLFGKRDFARK